MRRLTALTVGGLVTVALVAGGFWFLSSRGAAAEPASTTISSTESEDEAEAGSEAEAGVETGRVERRTLQQAEEFEANIGYGETFALPGAAFGTVTWVPEKGAILRPGDMVYKVDERPTYWTTGDIPMYRALRRGVKGDDVKQLQRFLQSEGYLAEDASVDEKYGKTVRAAVKKWQGDHGLKKTGEVDSAQLLVLPYDGLRVASAPRIADPANGGLIEVTKPDLFVTAEVSARKKKAFEGDSRIEVELADGSRHEATVDEIEAVEVRDAVTGEQKFKIRLSVDAPAGQKPGNVQVDVIDVLADDVLAVPVKALAALVEGGYSVEVVGPDGGREYRKVEIGEFADGWVEITSGLAEGDEVVVSS